MMIDKILYVGMTSILTIGTTIVMVKFLLSHRLAHFFESHVHFMTGIFLMPEFHNRHKMFTLPESLNEVFLKT